MSYGMKYAVIGLWLCHSDIDHSIHQGCFISDTTVCNVSLVFASQLLLTCCSFGVTLFSIGYCHVVFFLVVVWLVIGSDEYWWIALYNSDLCLRASVKEVTNRQ